MEAAGEAVRVPVQGIGWASSAPESVDGTTYGLDEGYDAFIRKREECECYAHFLSLLMIVMPTHSSISTFCSS